MGVWQKTKKMTVLEDMAMFIKIMVAENTINGKIAKTYFGEIEIFSKALRQKEAIAEAKTHVFGLTRQAFLGILSISPD